MASSEAPSSSRSSAAATVAVGILASRLIGFVREVVVAFFFGVGPHADAFRAALKGANVLQNLLGEGTISAAFIPVYSRFLKEGRAEDAGRFAGAVFGLLLALVSVLVLLGIALAPVFVTILTPGFTADAGRIAAGEATIDRFQLTVQGIRIVFPMTGILVLSAWTLGILNSHRRFFLPYVAPVLWNITIIAALVGAAFLLVATPLSPGTLNRISEVTLTHLLYAAFVGALVGGLLQFLVQVPLVIRLLKGFRFSLSTKVEGVKETIRAFGPVVAGRGAYQISTWIDTILASQIAAGALGALGYAQIFYLLPISLFGMSVAASELPELSRLADDEQAAFMKRVEGSLRQIMFLTIPAFVGYLCFGLPMIQALLERGRFGLNDSWLIYLILGGYTLGLPATTASRLMQNAFYALHDTRTPARLAVLRVVVSTLVAIPMMIFLDRFGVATLTGTASENPLFLGAAGLALGASVGAWIELWRLRATLNRRIGFALPWRRFMAILGLALLAAAPAALLWWSLMTLPKTGLAVVVLGTFIVVYLGLAFFLRFDEMEVWAGRLIRRLRKR